MELFPDIKKISINQKEHNILKFCCIFSTFITLIYIVLSWNYFSIAIFFLIGSILICLDLFWIWIVGTLQKRIDKRGMPLKLIKKYDLAFLCLFILYGIDIYMLRVWTDLGDSILFRLNMLLIVTYIFSLGFISYMFTFFRKEHVSLNKEKRL
jgi:hypothetical protein